VNVCRKAFALGRLWRRVSKRAGEITHDVMVMATEKRLIAKKSFWEASTFSPIPILRKETPKKHTTNLARLKKGGLLPASIEIC